MSPGPSRRSSSTALADAVDLVAAAARGVAAPAPARSRAVSVAVVAEGSVAQLDRVGAARHLDDRGAEVGGEPFGVDGGGGDDHLEVGPAGEHVGEVAEQEVDVEAALVGLVDDQGVVAAQQPVALHLCQQDAVGHELDQGVLAHLVREAHRVADQVAHLGAQLLGDAGRHRAGGQAPGLRVPDQPPHTATQLEAHLRELRALARPRLAGDDHDLVVADGGQHVVAALGDGQRLGVGDGRDGGGAPGEAPLGLVHLDGDGGQGGGEGAGPVGVARRPGAVEPAPEALLVAQHERAEAGSKISRGEGHERSAILGTAAPQATALERPTHGGRSSQGNH